MNESERREKDNLRRKKRRSRLLENLEIVEADPESLYNSEGDIL